MKKKIAFFSVFYYILYLLLYVAVFYVAVKLLKTNNLAAAVVRAGALMFVLTPVYIAVFARFSLLRWYVDPIAAAIVPLFFYGGTIANGMTQGATFPEAFAQTNSERGFFLALIGLFLFGLLASFSFTRKEGKSISYRLLDKILAK